MFELTIYWAALRCPRCGTKVRVLALGRLYSQLPDGHQACKARKPLADQDACADSYKLRAEGLFTGLPTAPGS